MIKMPSEKSYYCEKCNRTMGREQFYSSNNLEKYPNEGVFPQCKKCMTMHVDNWDPDTYIWILQEADVPYIPEEWNKLMATYAKDRSKVTGMSIIGRYLSKMKLKQWKQYRWKDTEFLQELANNKIEQTMKRQGYDAAQIATAINKATFELPPGEIAIPEYEEGQEDTFVQSPTQTTEEEAFDLGLTEEDIRYLRLKWGKMYRPEEWVTLEQLYVDMMNSYDIQAAGDINTLKLACKSSLKANQLLDLGDIDGAQKASKMYEAQMKAGKWTAAQNKTDENELVDSIGELVAICEKDGFIPAYYVDGPKDKVDRVIQDMQIYTRELVTNELGLGNMIENALKAIEDEKEHIKEAGNYAEALQNSNEEDNLFNYEKPILEDEDFDDFNNLQEAMSNEDTLSYQLQEEGE